MYNTLTTQRIGSIDAFRGITILVMIFVNDVSGVSGIPAWMKHKAADADAMTFVDVVFPAFLFIVGMSLPFAINNRISIFRPGLSRRRRWFATFITTLVGNTGIDRLVLFI